MKQKDFKNRLKNKMTFKNFLILLHIAKGCADEGLVINSIDVGDFIYIWICLMVRATNFGMNLKKILSYSED